MNSPFDPTNYDILISVLRSSIDSFITKVEPTPPPLAIRQKEYKMEK
jgi:hypothetical protein